MPHHTDKTPREPKKQHSQNSQSPEGETPSPPPHSSRNLFPFFSFGLPFSHHSQSPPRAQAVQNVGTIRTVADDGSYVLIELEPGVSVPPGRNLFVTGATGGTIQLKSAETENSYFIADVQSGHPSVGQIVQQ